MTGLPFNSRCRDLGRVQAMCLCLRMIAPEFEFWVEDFKWQGRVSRDYVIKYRPGLLVKSRHTRSIKIDWRRQIIDPNFIEALNRFRRLKRRAA